jgi:hypothetical protein
MTLTCCSVHVDDSNPIWAKRCNRRSNARQEAVGSASCSLRVDSANWRRKGVDLSSVEPWLVEGVCSRSCQELLIGFLPTYHVFIILYATQPNGLWLPRRFRSGSIGWRSPWHHSIFCSSYTKLYQEFTPVQKICLKKAWIDASFPSWWNSHVIILFVLFVIKCLDVFCLKWLYKGVGANCRMTPAIYDMKRKLSESKL